LPLGKLILTAAILVFVGRQFYRDLQRPELWDRSFEFGWLGLSGLLYLFGLGFSAFFWIRLLQFVGQRPEYLQAVRAYYLGHFGKYLPGKAWALFLRASLARSPGVRPGIAGVTAFYEVLTTMASGVLLAAILFYFLGTETSSPSGRTTFRRIFSLEEASSSVVDQKALISMSAVLFAILGIPIFPAIYNRLVFRLSLPFRGRSSPPPPRIPMWAYVEGLVVIAGGWLLLGASLWAVLVTVTGQNHPLSWESWGRYSAFLSLAYVLGFVVVPVPNGLGVREYFLTVFLTPELISRYDLEEARARSHAILAVLLLRLVWLAAEVILGFVLYWLPGPKFATMAEKGSAAP